MAKEYIEREEALQFKLTSRSEKITVAQAVSDAIAAYIKSIPAANVVEVVRCRECIYAPSGPEDGGFTLEWPHDRWPEDNPCPCKCDDDWYSHKPKPDFYCANGKRKNGGQDDVPM